MKNCRGNSPTCQSRATNSTMSKSSAKEQKEDVPPSLLKPPKKRSRCRDILDFVVLLGKIVLTYLCSFVHCFFPVSKKSLENEIVLVTGAARGLGRELAERFAELKAVVVLWDIDEAGLMSTQSSILAKNGRAHAFVCDVSSEEEVNRVGQQVKEKVGHVTILVNNAGILQNRPILELDSERIKKTFDINIIAHLWTIRCFLPKMLEMKKGHIVAISSAGGLLGWLFMGDYGATKFAVVGLMEVLEEELRAMGKGKEIRCTTVCPFTIDTGINHNPTCRLPTLLPLLDVKKSAAEIVLAVQRNERILTLPRRCLIPIYFGRLAPRRVCQLVLDYMQYNMLPNNLEVP